MFRRRWQNKPQRTNSIFRRRHSASLSPLCLVWFSNQLIKQQHSRWWKAVLMSTLNFILPSWGSTSAIKMDRWQKERGGDEEEAMTGGAKTAGFLVRLSVSWESVKASHTHVVLSLRLITDDIFTEGHECKMSQHFNCCHALASSQAASH